LNDAQYFGMHRSGRSLRAADYRKKRFAQCLVVQIDPRDQRHDGN